MSDRGYEYLDELEVEAIYILREAAAQAKWPVLLFSIGKDSCALLHLARKAFYPGPVPFPVLHVDTKWEFREMIEFRDSEAKRLGLHLIVHTNPEGLARGINPIDHGSRVHTEIMKTLALRQALDGGGYDCVFGAARRDEEASRAKERIFSYRNAYHQWEPRYQRSEVWTLYNARVSAGESMRVFPLSNWTELDVWRYVRRERIPTVGLYFAKPRPTVIREGMLIMVDDDRLPLAPGEKTQERMIRFRTLDCYPLSGAVQSHAATLEEVIAEIEVSPASERQGRLIDKDQVGAMEKKREGYF
ncbi:MAG: sulfate adenylyltransferase subunit CysD [Burkholderiales bacterium]